MHTVKRFRLAIFSIYCSVAVLLDSLQRGYQFWWKYPISTRIALSRAAAGDADLGQFILPGLRKIRGFSSTLQWWHGAWVGQVPFWRPLTSYLFWFEYKIFPYRYDYWYDVTVVSHLIFCAILVLFVAKLSGRLSSGLLTVLVFSGASQLSPIGASWYSFDLIGTGRHPPSSVALDLWKNQPEIWSSIFVVGALALLLYKKWGLSLVSACTAIAFKENGWLTFPLALLILWGTGNITKTPKYFYLAALCCFCVMMLIRLNCGRDVLFGYHYGHNTAWVHRYILAAMRPYPAAFYGRDISQPLLATGVFAAWKLYKIRPLYGWLMLIVGLGMAIGAGMYVEHTDAITASVILFTLPDNLESAVAGLLWLLGFDILWNGKTPRLMILSLVGSVLVSTALIALAAQVQVHVLYLAFAFRSILFALTMITVWDRLSIRLPFLCNTIATDPVGCS